MANYKRISEIATLAEVTDAANILVEENGVFKKISSSEIGGGIPVIILKKENYDNYFSGGPSEAAAEAICYYTCENATFNEVVQMYQNGKPFMIFVKDITNETPHYIITDSIRYVGESYFKIECYFASVNAIYWGDKGISNNSSSASSSVAS